MAVRMCRKTRRQEEHDNVHDPESPRGLIHRTLLLPRDVDEVPADAALRAVFLVGQWRKQHDAGDQHAEVTQVNHGDPELCQAGVRGDCEQCPCRCENCDDEEAENAIGWSR